MEAELSQGYKPHTMGPHFPGLFTGSYTQPLLPPTHTHAHTPQPVRAPGFFCWMSLPLQNNQELCLVFSPLHLLLEEEIWSPILDSELLEERTFSFTGLLRDLAQVSLPWLGLINISDLLTSQYTLLSTYCVQAVGGKGGH